MSYRSKPGKAPVRLGLLLTLTLLAFTVVITTALAAISISTNTPATENFDEIGTAAAATLPADWRVDMPSTVRTVGNYATALTATSLVGGANLSTSASNGIYNFGSGTTTTGPDRAVDFFHPARRRRAAIFTCRW